MLFFILISVHAHNEHFVEAMGKRELFIQSDSFGLYLFEAECDYHIYAAEGGNKTTYSYPIENDFHLTYNGEFVVNNHSPNIINQTGTLTPPILVKELLRPINSLMEPIQVCYDFTTERLSLKVTVGILGLLVLLSNGTKIGTLIEKISPDLPQSSFARWFSRPRGSMAGSQTSYTSVEKETGL